MTENKENVFGALLDGFKSEPSSDQVAFIERIRICVEKAGNQTLLAQKAGISQSGLNRYLTGSDPSRSALIAIAKAAEVALEWLATGQEPGAVPLNTLQEPRAHYGHADEEFVFLPLYRNVRVSGGDGAVVWDESEVDSIAFQDSFIRHELRAAPRNLKLARVTGDSMERLIYSGDVVMFDTSIDYLKGEGMYVFRIDDQIAVKWLYSLPGNVTRVASENQEKYPPFEIRPEEAKSGRFKIIGQVRWWAHTQR